MQALARRWAKQRRYRQLQTASRAQNRHCITWYRKVHGRYMIRLWTLRRRCAAYRIQTAVRRWLGRQRARLQAKRCTRILTQATQLWMLALQLRFVHGRRTVAEVQHHRKQVLYCAVQLGR